MILSPRLAEHYAALKQQASDCLLLTQVGAFMDVLHEDVRVVAQLTGLKLQMAVEVASLPNATNSKEV